MAADTPVIWYPSAANLDFRLRDRLLALKAPYSGAGAQVEVEWAIYSDAGATALVWTSGLRAPDDIDLGVDWCQIHLDAIGLASGTTYYLRCRVRNDVVETSSWCAVVAIDIVGVAASVWEWTCA